MSTAAYTAALGYVDRCGAWPLFPADARTKRPIIPTGRDHAEYASIDLATIERWFAREFRGAAIGMPTGAASGTVVIDADRKHDGEEKLAKLEAELGALPRTKMVRTQSGGLHVYTAHPGDGIRVRTGAGSNSPLGRLLGAPGLDVRADGGIVILPPSCGYKWIADDDEPLPPLPLTWLAAIQGAGDERENNRLSSTSGSRDPQVDSKSAFHDDTSTIPKGERNDTLFALGVKLRRIGCSESEILYGLERANTMRCERALPDREVKRIAASAAKEKR